MKITFRINLANPNLLSQDVASTISTWLPNRFRNNYVFKHNDLVTLYGNDAKYFLDNYTENAIVEDLHVASKAIATTTMIPVGTPVVVGSFQNAVGEELTVLGGTSSQAAKIIVNSVHTVVGQNQINFNPGEDNGTFTGGDGYVATNTITMSDGTVVVVDSVSVGETTAVLTFHITVDSTTPITTNHPTLTQVSTSGSGTGFTLTLGTANQRIEVASYKQTGGINEGVYTAIPSDPVTASTSATFTMDWGVGTITVTDGGDEYAAVPAVTFSGAGGSGTTATAVLDGDIVSSITLDSAGSGYTAAATVAVESP